MPLLKLLNQKPDNQIGLILTDYQEDWQGCGHHFYNNFHHGLLLSFSVFLTSGVTREIAHAKSDDDDADVDVLLKWLHRVIIYGVARASVMF